MLRANLALIFVMFAWGTQIPAMTLLLEHWDPYFLGWLRYAWAVPLIVLAAKLIEPGPLLPRAVPWWQLALLGMGCAGFFAPAYTVGVAYSNPVTAAILASAGPAVSAIVASLFFKQRIAPSMYLTILLAVVGCVVATYDPSLGADPFDFRGGEPLIPLAAMFWAFYTLAAQRWLPGWSQLRVSAVTIVPGAFMTILFWIAAIQIGIAQPVPNAIRDLNDLWLHGWVSVGAVMLGLIFWNYGAAKLGLVVASMFLNFIPIVSILTLAWLGTPPTWPQLAGGALVLLGILWAQWQQIRRPAPAA